MIQIEIKAPIGREYDGQEHIIKCMDSGVTFAVSLYTMESISPWREMAVPYQIPDGSTAKLRVTRPDRAYTDTKTTIQDGTILCPVHPYSVATPGKCSADVAVYGPDGNRLTSATFSFFVDRECAPTAGENAPVFVDSIQGLIEFVERSAERAEAAADRAESSGGGNGGNPPKDGITPHIGANGNWYIGTTDTGVSAEGEDGEDGGHYTPVVTQPTTDTIKIAFTPSKATMPAVAPVTVQLPAPSESNGAGEHPDNPVVDGITVGGENGVRFESEGEPSTPVLALYGAQGGEPVRVSHVAPAQEDGEAVPLGQVKQLVKEHSGQNPVQGIGITTIMAITQEKYDELVMLETVDDATLYIIKPESEDAPDLTMIPVLRSDGTAYIDLGIAPIDGAWYEVCFRGIEVGQKAIFGNRFTRVSGAGGDLEKNWMSGYYNGSQYATFGSGAIDISKKRTYAVSSKALTLDGDTITEITAGTNTKKNNMLLFSANNSDQANAMYVQTPCTIDLFYLRIWSGENKLLHNYVPAQDAEGVACVYDTVTKEYLHNAAETGAFEYREELEES